MEDKTDLLNEFDLRINAPKRRTLLPWWIKIFIWIFLVFGAIIPVALIFGILGYNFQLSLYGLVSNNPLSLMGISLMVIFSLKGFTAFSLWTEKDWAINFAFADAILGILICSFLMIIYPFFKPGFMINIRLELTLLIPYFLWLKKIKADWHNSNKILFS